MWVHWTKKIMRFQHKGTSIKLKGPKPEVTKCTAISAGKLKGLIRRKAIAHCIQLTASRDPAPEQLTFDTVCQVESVASEDTPAPITDLLSKYEDVFQKPTAFPPTRQ